MAEKGEPVSKVVPIAWIGWVMMCLGWLIMDGIGTALFRGGVLLLIGSGVRLVRTAIESS